MVGDFEFGTRHNVRECPEYKFEIEEYRRGGDQLLIAHFRVHHWSSSTLKRAVKEWHIFRKCVTAPLFAFAEVDDAKWEAFVSLFGFKPLTNIICNNGEQRRLFIHQIDCISHAHLAEPNHKLKQHD